MAGYRQSAFWRLCALIAYISITKSAVRRDLWDRERKPIFSTLLVKFTGLCRGIPRKLNYFCKTFNFVCDVPTTRRDQRSSIVERCKDYPVLLKRAERDGISAPAIALLSRGCITCSLHISGRALLCYTVALLYYYSSLYIST